MALLIVEDELRVRSFIARGLAEEGFQVHECINGTEALRRLQAERFDLVLLDWMLPGQPGVEVLRRLRSAGDTTPVLMLTARDAVEDRVEGLNTGADDYIVKPFSFVELLARVRAILRRVSGRPSSILRCADLTLNPLLRKVTRAGVDVHLTTRELALLQFLMQHAGQVLSRTRIAEAVWNQGFDTSSNVVEVYIRYLRAKVDEPFGRRLIQTVRGAGYMLREGP
jgi:DNA-binding response OmpR family regulator